MHRSSYPAGDTSASRIKSLVLYLEAEKSGAEANACTSAKRARKRG